MSLNKVCYRYCNKNTGLLLIRIALAAVFIVHGVSKLQNMDGVINFFGTLGLAPWVAWLVALIETVGGFLVLLGWKTRHAALLLAVVMIGVLFTAKKGSPFVGQGGYEFEFTLLLISLALATTGAGRYSLGKICDNCRHCDCGCHGNNNRCGEDGQCHGCGCR